MERSLVFLRGDGEFVVINLFVGDVVGSLMYVESYIKDDLSPISISNVGESFILFKSCIDNCEYMGEL
jgi:hypothetical protein